MRRKKRELVALFLDDDPRLPWEVWYLILEISGLCRTSKRYLWWHIHYPRFISCDRTNGNEEKEDRLDEARPEGVP